jgi:hypothetical protein
MSDAQGIVQWGVAAVPGVGWTIDRLLQFVKGRRDTDNDADRLRMEADQAAFARLESLVKLLSQRVEYLENHVKVVEAENAALRREIDQMRKD